MSEVVRVELAEIDDPGTGSEAMCLMPEQNPCVGSSNQVSFDTDNRYLTYRCPVGTRGTTERAHGVGGGGTGGGAGTIALSLRS